MSVAIKVENLSKAYQLGEIGTGTLSNDLKRWAYKVRGKEDPFLKIGETNDRTAKGESDMVWSLKDLDFEIEQGDAVGIIGRNGAGKSTLLKILSRVTSPTTGSVKVKGRVASLLEVGTGFHPELTGRENIFLNGAILGMRKAEIKKHFDAIVDFAGVERYIDTPVKRYSSGMYVRLAFAVAAHLESEILIVDEVLAVGDAEFQKKCLGKMNDVSKGEGRTILFVSHNMVSIKELCKKSILLNNGLISCYSNTDDVIRQYFDTGVDKENYEINWKKEERPGNQAIQLKNIHFSDKKNNFELSENISVIFDFAILIPNKYNISISVINDDDVNVLSSPSITDKNWFGKIMPVGEYSSEIIIPKLLLNDGTFNLYVIIVENGKAISAIEKAIYFHVFDAGHNRQGFFGKWSGIIRPQLTWSTVKNEY